MVERWKIYLMMAFIALTVIPISLACADILVSPWALIAGHGGAMVVGMICSEWSRGEGE